MDYKEIEVRFLDVDQEAVIAQLHQIGAVDKGEDVLKEVIFYDADLKWRDENRFVRLRQRGDVVKMTYKHHREGTDDADRLSDVDEVEIKVSELAEARLILENIGLRAFRTQEKKRHSFVLGDVMVEFDTWPTIPTMMELEGPDEAALQVAAEKLNLNWANVYYGGARTAIEKVYNVPVSQYTHFTFEKQG